MENESWSDLSEEANRFYRNKTESKGSPSERRGSFNHIPPYDCFEPLADEEERRRLLHVLGPNALAVVPLEKSLVGQIARGECRFSEVVAIIDELLRYLLDGPGQYCGLLKNTVLWTTKTPNDDSNEPTPPYFVEGCSWEEKAPANKYALLRYLVKSPNQTKKWENIANPNLEEGATIYRVFLAHITAWSDDIVIGMSEVIYRLTMGEVLSVHTSMKIAESFKTLCGTLSSHLLMDATALLPPPKDDNHLAHRAVIRRNNLRSAYNLLSAVICNVQHGVALRKYAQERRREGSALKSIRVNIDLPHEPRRDFPETVLANCDGSTAFVNLTPKDGKLHITNFNHVLSSFHKEDMNDVMTSLMEKLTSDEVFDRIKKALIKRGVGLEHPPKNSFTVDDIEDYSDLISNSIYFNKF